MQKVGCRELKNRMGRDLAEVRKGKSLVVTDRGRAVAKLSPLDPADTPEESLKATLERLQQQGLLRLAKGGGPTRVRPAPCRGKSAAGMILEDRG